MSKYLNMRLLLMFDLPSKEEYEKKNYTKFMRELIKTGYYMIQFSIYMKVINSNQKIESEIQKIKKIAPLNGEIRIISLTEVQYQNMKIINGSKSMTEKYNGIERYIKI